MCVDIRSEEEAPEEEGGRRQLGDAAAVDENFRCFEAGSVGEVVVDGKEIDRAAIAADRTEVEGKDRLGHRAELEDADVGGARRGG